MKLKIFSFFSGAGFLDLGFENEGFDIVFVNEYSKEFLKAYKFARQQMKLEEPKYGYYNGDINNLLRGQKRADLKKEVEEERKNGLVGFIGGPPCPDFSIAGKNQGINGKNGMLTNSYKRVILDQEPDFFVFENVKGLWSTKKHRTEYDKIKRAFSRKGYVLVDKLVNSLDYGVPQERERVILFGIKSSIISEIKLDAGKKIRKEFTWGGNSSFCKEKREHCIWPTTNNFIENSNVIQPRDIISELCIEYWFRKNDVEHHYNTNDYFIPHSVERFTTIEEGDVSKKSFKRLHRWRYSPTVAYGNNEVHLHPYHARRLSVAEALAIQSLPKEYMVNKELSKSDMFKTIGNGVPYLMARGIAKSVRTFIEKNSLVKNTLK